MTAWKEYRGIILFCLIAIIVIAGALVAFKVTGPMGIEERFNAATGIIGEEEDDAGTGIAGFFLEGNVLSYILILIGLAVLCFVVYKKYNI